MQCTSMSSTLVNASVEANGFDRLPHGYKQSTAPLHDDDFQCKITQVRVELQENDLIDSLINMKKWI